MRVGVLTSSRADYSIYYPLLKMMEEDSFFDLTIIAFGTHLSPKHGYTLSNIMNDRFRKILKVETTPSEDSPFALSTAIGRTIIKFASFWSKKKFDLVFCLGDRFEMFAACTALVPFNTPLAHIHGGETTLGAIDEVFRHSITQMASFHFTAAAPYQRRVKQLKGHDKHIYNVGALSIDNLNSLQLLTVDEFKQLYGIDLAVPSILITFHPETVAYEKNIEYVNELTSALKEISEYQLIITMPNADTMGNLVRERLHFFIKNSPKAFIIESFGTVGYLSCMKHCSFMLGNTSSGFIEASFFPKYVINLGERQKGRIVTKNIYNCKIKSKAILNAIENFKTFQPTDTTDIYGKGNTAKSITSIIKHTYG